MTGQWRTFLAMLFVTVVAAGFAGWGGVEYGLHRSAPRTDLDTVLHHDLDLTGDQERDVRALETAFSRDRDALQAEMHAANRDLARAITEEHAYGPDAHRAIARFHAAMASLQEKTVQHVLAMRAVLTPAQAQRFDQSIRETLGTDAP